MIALLDYGSGNLRSAQKALLKVGADVRVVKSPKEIGDARAMVLPGVGAFDDCINALRKQELLEAARDFIKTGKPFLGICVGYQALFERSEEFNSCAAGLGVFKGSVIRFSEKHGLKIPQIGWNQIEIVKTGLPALSRHCRRQLRLFRPQLLSAAGGQGDRRHAHGIRRHLCVVRLARQCFRHAISPGKKPESRPATAEELCGTGERLKKTWQRRSNDGTLDKRYMATLTLDSVLTEAEALPADEQEMLEGLLRRRRIEAWRQETASEAKHSIKAFRSGKLKSQPAENVIARLRNGK